MDDQKQDQTPKPSDASAPASPTELASDSPSDPAQNKAQPPHAEGMSYQTKSIIVILLLVLIYPLGLLLMYIWMKWPAWVKALLTAFLVVQIVIGALVFNAFAKAIAEDPRLQNALECATQCSGEVNQKACTNTCMERKLQKLEL